MPVEIISLRPKVSLTTVIRGPCADCGMLYQIGTRYRCQDCATLLMPCDKCGFYLTPEHYDDLGTVCSSCKAWHSVEHPKVDPTYWVEFRIEVLAEFLASRRKRAKDVRA